MRVLEWILARTKGKGKAVESPIGMMPAQGALNFDGLGLSPDAERQLLAVNSDEWRVEVLEREKFFRQFGDRLPEGIRAENEALRRRLA